ncbi:GGDEF domain-containing protein [Deinococcus maricopensis]|uniref:Diguanylate cyclase with GAF sensor n=1 Tax=Deinococcus maricopensis (strain DSM 21211 / LMG 22137 / NRRL B-23946 / LB-34) TaxID=709986 RepID=E8U8J2_DEIML|nr:sensor domain-containing diguanylate cyclase [Deinococcus maricopensis]ADV67381.1 diguanylate cyclase with GAF sensor [Deinococcus maricopensis DSM 21211]
MPTLDVPQVSADLASTPHTRALCRALSDLAATHGALPGTHPDAPLTWTLPLPFGRHFAVHFPDAGTHPDAPALQLLQSTLPTIAGRVVDREWQGITDAAVDELTRAHDEDTALTRLQALVSAHVPATATCTRDAAHLDAGVHGDDHTLTLPIHARYRPLVALTLTGDLRGWTADDRARVTRLTRVAGALIEQIRAQTVVEHLLNFQRVSLHTPPSELYRALMDLAIQCVPGAQAGSILVYENDQYVFRAWHGYSDDEFEGVAFSAQQQQQWYGLSAQEWHDAQPRLLSAADVPVRGAGFIRDDAHKADTLPSVERIQVNLAVPILYEGEVYAMLNLDNHTRAQSFDADSVQAARLVATQAALIVHEVHARQHVRTLATTDALTGLGNRRAYDDALRRAHLHGARENVTLMVIDMAAFKQLNDLHGHAEGDDALRTVARTLLWSVRRNDQAFRWGGDEFAVILLGATESDADVVARRFARLLPAPLRAHIGIAQRGATATPAEWARLADTAMYTAKRQGLPITRASTLEHVTSGTPDRSDDLR